MAISFTCGTCGKPYKVDERFAGKKAACRACGTVNKIPAGAGAVKLRAAPADGLRPVVQSEPVRAAPGLLDDDLTLPLAEVDDDPISDDAPARLAARDEGLDLMDETMAPTPAPVAPKAAAPRRAAPVRALPADGCPNCGSPLEGGAVFCTGCGFNLKTKKRVSTTVADDGEGGDAFDPDAPGPREPTPALRATARWLIVAAGVASLLVIIGMLWKPLAPMGSFFALIGSLAGMVGAVIYFIDGAMQWGLVGAGATLVSMILLCAIGMRGSGQVAAAPPPPPPVKVVKAPATAPDLGPKIAEVSPGRFSLRPPAANEDPVLYWRPELQDSDPRVRVIAIGQLTQVPEEYRESAAEVICEVAADENVAVRRAVMSGLSIYKSPSAVPAAIKGLEDADLQVARSAAALLGQYKEESAIQPLVAKYPTLGDPVVSALAAYGNSSKEKVVEAYKSLMGSGDPKRQLAIMTKLVQADPASAAPMLGAYVADGDLLVRTTAINLLGELKYEPAIPAIVDRLRDDSEAAAQALLKFGPAAEVAMAGKLQDGEPKFRLQALQILKEIATPLSLPAIKAAAKDPDMSVALAAREVWRKIVPGALAPIDEALMDLDGDKELLIRSLKALATLPVDEHQTVISRKLYDIVMGNGEKPIPSLACDALAVWADAATRARMIEALKPESDDQKKVYAIRLAVQFKDPRAVRPLCECLAQGRSLPEVMDALIDFGTLSETYLMRLISQGDSGLQTKAFSLLREVGTRRCFMVITPLLGNKNTDVELKKQARDTIIAINRRLNSAAARKAPPMMPARPLTPVPAQP